MKRWFRLWRCKHGHHTPIHSHVGVDPAVVGLLPFQTTVTLRSCECGYHLEMYDFERVRVA